MAHNRGALKGRQAFPQRNDGGTDLIVLPIGERCNFVALQFDPHGVVVAVLLAPEDGISSVPGAFHDAHELHQFAVAPHQEMRRNAHVRQPPEVRMVGGVQPAVEQVLDLPPTELARRK